MLRTATTAAHFGTNTKSLRGALEILLDIVQDGPDVQAEPQHVQRRRNCHFPQSQQRGQLSP